MGKQLRGYFLRRGQQRCFFKPPSIPVLPPASCLLRLESTKRCRDETEFVLWHFANGDDIRFLCCIKLVTR